MKTTRERIEYTGPKTSRGLYAAAAKLSRETLRYIVCCTVFSEAWFYASDALPTGLYDPTDYPAGYWHKGVRHNWSSARRAKCHSAGMNACDR